MERYPQARVGRGKAPDATASKNCKVKIVLTCPHRKTNVVHVVIGGYDASMT